MNYLPRRNGCARVLVPGASGGVGSAVAMLCKLRVKVDSRGNLFSNFPYFYFSISIILDQNEHLCDPVRIVNYLPRESTHTQLIGSRVSACPYALLLCMATCPPPTGTVKDVHD